MRLTDGTAAPNIKFRFVYSLNVGIGHHQSGFAAEVPYGCCYSLSIWLYCASH